MIYNRITVLATHTSVRDIAEEINTTAMSAGRGGAFDGDARALQDSVDFVQAEIGKVNEQDRQYLRMVIEAADLNADE